MLINISRFYDVPSPCIVNNRVSKHCNARRWILLWLELTAVHISPGTCGFRNGFIANLRKGDKHFRSGLFAFS